MHQLSGSSDQEHTPTQRKWTSSAKFSKLIADTHVQCDENLAGKAGEEWSKGFAACNKEADESLAAVIPVVRLDAAIVALVPVALGWGSAYLILFLVRWVKRGFKER